MISIAKVGNTILIQVDGRHRLQLMACTVSLLRVGTNRKIHGFGVFWRLLPILCPHIIVPTESKR